MVEFFDPLRNTYTFLSIGKVLFGVNAVAQVGIEAKRLNVGKKGMIITDPGVLKAGLIDKVLEPLKKEGFNVNVCPKALPEPTIESIKDVANYAREAEVGFIIALGGGSSMDTAKIVGRAVTNPGDLKKYLEEGFKEHGIPVITIPTTAGTGAEFTKEAVVVLPEERVKGWFDDVRAVLAIVDPLMTLTLPAKLTAATGIDALCHAVESALAIGAFPLTQALALESIRLISENLRRATYHGSDLKARYNMALATIMEAFSEGNCGDVEGHAAAHVIGAYYHIHHGLTCGIALPYAMERNIPVNEEILTRIAVAMGEDVRGLSMREASYKGIYAVIRLLKDLNLPTALKEVEGIDKEHLSELVDLFITNPRITAFFANCKRKMTKDDAMEFFENMWVGRIGKP
jgi:alcohol dehydrogenase